MFLSKISIERPKMLSMIILAILIFGVMSYLGLPVAMMPDTDLPFVTVQTIYTGASPKEVEILISKKIEDAVSTISSIKELRSYSLENYSYVMLEFETDKDGDIAKQEVKDKVDAIIPDLPSDAERPIVVKHEMGAEALFEVAFTGSSTVKELYDFADKNIKDRLSQIKGVGSVNISGGLEREIHVIFDRKVLEGYGISLLQAVQFIQIQNFELPGGNIRKSGNEYSVKLEGKYKTVEEIGETEIQTPMGAHKLRDIATIVDAQEELREKASFYLPEIMNGEEINTVSIEVVKSTGANEVEIAHKCKAEIEKIKAEIPAGTTLYIADDASLFTEGSLDDTLSNIYIGIVLTALILLLFLHDFRSTLIVAITMPVSVVATFVLISVSGFTLNMMSLLGISISVGILVTNSIVIIENIYRHIKMGDDKKTASNTGASEIAIAVASTTLTNVVVFLPIASMSSIVGQIFRQFGLTVTYATLVSLIASFSLTPMLSAILLKSEKIRKMGDIMSLKGFPRLMEGMFLWFENLYRRILKFIVYSKVAQIAVVVVTVALLLFSFGLFGEVGMEFLPFVDAGDIEITLELPTNYNLDRTSAIVKDMESRLREYEAIKSITTVLGTSGGLDIGLNRAKIDLKLVDSKDRDISSFDFTGELRKQFANIPDANLKINAKNPIGGGPGADIELYVMGQEQEKVIDIALDLYKKFEQIEGAVDVDTDYRPGKPEVKIIPNRQKMAEYGINIQTVSMELRASIEGFVSSKYREEGNEYDIKVKLSDFDKSSPEQIGQIPINTPRGTFRIEQFADLEYKEGSTRIVRRDKYNTITITLSAGSRSMGEILSDMKKIINETEFPNGYKTKVGGQARMMEESNMDMAQALILAVVLTYMLLVAILESFLEPFIIFFTIPLSLIGVALSMYFTGQTMNIFSIMSVIMLVGIVVNNAILLIDYTNVLIRQGMPEREALIQACPVKLKPIVMSTLAIAIAMLPLAMGVGSYGVEMRQGMGIVTIGGLIVAAVFTMLIIPILYEWFVREKKETKA